LHLIFEPIFFAAFLVAVSILAGMFSTRIGAPLLLVFLGLGMLAGVDGIVGIEFNDFRLTYLVGNVALALILFDGGLRTPREAFRIALWPAVSLATIGVIVTAGIAGAAAVHFLGFTPLEGLLVGATVASTDAAAVFLLLHTRGTELKRRVSATLEIESGVNDPMAVFLTISCVELLLSPDLALTGHFVLTFATQLVGGVAIGFLGGMFLVFLINRVEIAAGLYPILAAATALIIFAGAQIIDASGFLAVYLAGLVMGNQRHRAQQVISRFHDGLAWLAQITMFLLLGLLATPSQMVSHIGGELAIAILLIVVARPLAVWLSLIPFRFTWQEKTFISWVGLRGAVPIFLASIPVIAGVPRGIEYFNVAFVVVIASLIVQGWTVSRAAQLLGLELPPPPEPVERREIDLPPSADREAASWRVAANSPALDLTFHGLNLPRRTRIIAVIRDGTVMNRETLERLDVDDYVIALAPPEHVITLDKLFSTRPAHRTRWAALELGEFSFEPNVSLGRLCAEYGVPFEPLDLEKPLAAFMRDRLGDRFVVGDRVRIGNVELVIREISKGKIARIGLAVEPEAERLPILRLWRRLTGRRTMA
jgi:cell volume regulation protein A